MIGIATAPRLPQAPLSEVLLSNTATRRCSHATRLVMAWQFLDLTNVSLPTKTGGSLTQSFQHGPFSESNSHVRLWLIQSRISGTGFEFTVVEALSLLQRFNEFETL